MSHVPDIESLKIDEIAIMNRIASDLTIRLPQVSAVVSLTAEGFKDVGKGPGSRAGEFIEWLTIKDLAQSVVDDVERIRNHPLVPGNIPIYGYIYDVASGALNEVAEATKRGAASA